MKWNLRINKTTQLPRSPTAIVAHTTDFIYTRVNTNHSGQKLTLSSKSGGLSLLIGAV